ncbi:MAG: hypothetical protein WBP12_05890 [Candidatus Saccharimonas sp.]
MNTDRKDQYRIPTSPIIPGEVIKTYDLSRTLTAEQALKIARAVAGETQPLDPNNTERARNERFGAAMIEQTAAVVSPTVEQSEPAFDPMDYRQFSAVGKLLHEMRNEELAA